VTIAQQFGPDRCGSAAECFGLTRDVRGTVNLMISTLRAPELLNREWVTRGCREARAALVSGAHPERCRAAGRVLASNSASSSSSNPARSRAFKRQRRLAHPEERLVPAGVSSTRCTRRSPGLGAG